MKRLLHITLAKKRAVDDPDDPLQRTHHGWGASDTVEQNWKNNRGYWVLGARASRESYVLFSYSETHLVVMAARIDAIVDAAGKPGRKVLRGKLLSEDDPIYKAYVGKPTPPSARVRNPVTYFESTVGGWPCGCGCGTEIFVGEFVRGHEQTALHQRVAQIGTIPEFLRWFDAVRSDIASPAGPESTSINISRPGKLDLTVSPAGAINIRFAPTDDTPHPS